MRSSMTRASVGVMVVDFMRPSVETRAEAWVSCNPRRYGGTMNPTASNLQPSALYLAPMPLRFCASRGLAGVLAVVALACSPAPMPISTSSREPSSPFAPEGVTPSVPASAPPVAPPGNEQPHHQHVQQASDAGAEVYVCPMHPEVTSKTPGLCPKCNMKLVPKK